MRAGWSEADEIDNCVRLERRDIRSEGPIVVRSDAIQLEVPHRIPGSIGKVRLAFAAIDDDDVVARVDKTWDEEGADVTGATNDDNSHPDNVQVSLIAASSRAANVCGGDLRSRKGPSCVEFMPTGVPMKSSLLFVLCSTAACSTMSNQASSPEQAQNLFNGKDLSGWHVDVPARDSNSRLRNPFIVRNGMLVSLGEPRGHLISDASFSNYRLDVQYRFPGTPGNAGVLVHASTPRALYGMFPRSIEVQMESGNAGDFWCIVEDIRVPDMERRRGPPAEWGITEGKARRIMNLTDNSEKPVGEWNTMQIEANGRTIKVWVNGDLVNDGFDATADHGQIALQSEGSEVEFRQLVLTRLPR